MTFADKTSYMYQVTKEEHDKLLRNVITLKYKKYKNQRQNKQKLKREFEEQRSLTLN